jgi:hypothetical protein
MTLLGKAALAMWWDIAPAHQTEFADWHANEHFPERLQIPGFLRGSRWTSVTQGGGCFVTYELETYETLTSAAYLERLNNPSPWSKKMMPHHLNMVRSQCRVEESYGGGIAGSLLTLRLSPETGKTAQAREALRQVLSKIPTQPGLTGGHLLRTETPSAPQTEEQKIRGGRDAVADWIVLIFGYDHQTVAGLDLSSLVTAHNGINAIRRDIFRLAYALTPQDLA